MLIEETYQKLSDLRLHSFSKALREMDNGTYDTLTFQEKLSFLIDREWTEREEKRLSRRLKNAKLREAACLENINYQHVRGLDKNVVQRLATSQWINKHQTLL